MELPVEQTVIEKIDSWADDVEGIEGKVKKVDNTQQDNNTYAFKVFVGDYKFKEPSEIWSDNDCIKKALVELPNNIKFLVQLNGIIPFQLVKNNGRKYLIGDDHILYEFDKTNVLTHGFYKDRYLFWDEVASLNEIRKK